MIFRLHRLAVERSKRKSAMGQIGAFSGRRFEGPLAGGERMSGPGAWPTPMDVIRWLLCAGGLPAPHVPSIATTPTPATDLGFDLPLEAVVTPLPMRGGEALVRSLCEPLGWTVELTPVEGVGSSAGVARYGDLKLIGNGRLCAASATGDCLFGGDTCG